MTFFYTYRKIKIVLVCTGEGNNLMLFSSSSFLFFFLPIVIVIYYTILRKKRTLQNIFLFLASLLFYAWGEPAFVFVMLLSIVANYLFGLFVYNFKNNKIKSKVLLFISVLFNLSILFVFKYLAFVMENIRNLSGLDLPVPEIALPIGISFFTFQTMSYVIDVYRGEEVQKNPLNVGLYIAFFPQLIAGPIVRYETIANQIQNRKENFDDFSSGVCRFIIGLSKKVLLANTMAVVADSAFDGNINNISTSFAWLGAIAYTLQIFFDFSGYSDMAIGLGRMFGFKFLENFDYPYISSSITEFWRRWHISLGTWFRDYVYFPLGGSRVKHKSRLIFNLFVVWFLTGVWHGANWTFILWGLMYFVLLTIEKLTGFYKKDRFKILKHIYTLFFVVLGWVLFRADNVTDAFTYIGAMFGSTGVFVDSTAIYLTSENIVYFVFAIFISTPVIKMIYRKYIVNSKFAKSIVAIILLILFAVSITYIVKGTYNPFIYFNF